MWLTYCNICFTAVWNNLQCLQGLSVHIFNWLKFQKNIYQLIKSEWTPGVGDGQGGLACCDSWGRKESDTTERLNWTELNCYYFLYIKMPHNTIFWKYRGVISEIYTVIKILCQHFQLVLYMNVLSVLENWCSIVLIEGCSQQKS